MMVNETTLDRITAGYLTCAKWADAPEGSNARFTNEAKREARDVCAAFVKACGILADQALDQVGYSAERFGHDFWLSRCGHGAGFWDREELTGPPVQNWFVLDRDGKPYLPHERGGTLGEVLSGIAYGTNGAISQFAYPSLETYRGWLSFIETSWGKVQP